MNKATEIIERASVPSVDKAHLQVEEGAFAPIKTPDAGVELEGGALREGGPPNIYSKENIGLLVHYFGSGMIYSIIYSLVYPFLNNYLRMSGVATASASVLTALPYTLKVFFGIFSDCYPIFGYRRRPYIVIGWIICAVCCLVMAVTPIGEPYYPDPSYAFVDPKTLPAEVVASFNTDAPGSGSKFVVLLIIANLGMVMAFTASGGTLVELSQREPENVRGTLQAMIWVWRDFGGMIASALVGFGLNSADFGGSFDGSIGVSGLMIICTVVSVLTCLSGWYNITEEKAPRLSLRVEAGKVFDLMQLKVVYYVLAFQLFKNMFAYIGVTAAYPIQSVWARVEPVNSSIASILTSLVSAGALTFVAKFGLNWNWRYIIIASQLCAIAIDVIPTFFTIWDVYRSQWFWLGVPLLEQIPTNFSFIVSTFVMIEVMDVGSNEATFYGLMSSVSSLASPFSTVITKNIDSNFEMDLELLQADTHYVRTQVTYAYLCQYGMQIFSLVFVFLLPRQKAETQALKREGGKSFAVGAITVVLLLFFLVWAVMTNLMSIYPSTACLVIAGGTGCP